MNWRATLKKYFWFSEFCHMAGKQSAFGLKFEAHFLLSGDKPAKTLVPVARAAFARFLAQA